MDRRPKFTPPLSSQQPLCFDVATDSTPPLHPDVATRLLTIESTIRLLRRERKALLAQAAKVPAVVGVEG